MQVDYPRYVKMVDRIIRAKIGGALAMPVDCKVVRECYRQGFKPAVAADCAVDTAVDMRMCESGLIHEFESLFGPLFEW
jgi:hypothetical protein